MHAVNTILPLHTKQCCSASEMKLMSSMSFLVCQPFNGSSLLQERILETSTTTGSEYYSFGGRESLQCNQDHDYIQVMTSEIPGEVVPIFVDNTFLLAIHVYRWPHMLTCSYLWVSYYGYTALKL